MDRLTRGRDFRTCSRLKITVVQEYTHPRMRLDCDYSQFVPLKSCPHWQREPGSY